MEYLEVFSSFALASLNLNFLVLHTKASFFSLNNVVEEGSCCGHIAVPRSLLGFHQFVVIYCFWIFFLLMLIAVVRLCPRV